MSAIRLARAFTRRNKIVKFDGCYHGHSDGLLVRAGSGLATLSLPDSSGVPATFARETLVAQFNDLDSIETIFARHGKDIAAVIVEPICGNIGVILPQLHFLAHLRKITQQHRALLIFDEVITGFRVGIGGAQKLFKIEPDLTCLGKILGGGLPWPHSVAAEKLWINSHRSGRFTKPELCRVIRWQSRLGLRH